MNSFKQKTSLSCYLSSLRMGVICEFGLCAAVYSNRVSTATYIIIVQCNFNDKHEQGHWTLDLHKKKTT